MNRSLGTALLAKPSRLTGEEVRFLRKSLGWSARTFAARMGTSTPNPKFVPGSGTDFDWGTEKDPAVVPKACEQEPGATRIELAALGTSPETVSRWETGKQSMAQSSERLLRVLVAIEQPIEEYTSESLEHIDDEAPRSQRQVARNTGDLWTVERAA